MSTRRARGGVFVACTLVACAFLLATGGPSFASGTSASAVGSESRVAPSPSPTPTPSPTPSPTQTTTYKIVPEEFSLMISPTRLVIGPADMDEPHTITVVNRGESPMHVQVQAQSFVGGLDGSLALQEDAPYSAATWVTIEPASFDLQSGESQDVITSVAMPADADLGDHQVALVFLVPAGETDANIKINRGIATPVYITVPGITDHSAEVSALAAPGFSGGGPVTVTALVQNTGTVHRDFRGETALAISGTDSDFPDFTVARGGGRNISAEWQPPVFCICELTVSITNADSVSTTASVRVIVFPVIPAMVILGVLLLVALLMMLARHRYVKSVRPAAAELRPPPDSDV